MYHNGRSSYDVRALTACDLYHRGIVKVLVLSGGRDPKAPLSEPACMALICIDAGVPEDALILDELGVDTRASVRTARALAAAHDWDRVLMVSHDPEDARRIADQTIVVADGRASNPKDTFQILDNPPPALQEYLRASPKGP